MTAPYWLSRLVLRRDADASAPARTGDAAPGAVVNQQHRLIWTLMSDGPERDRDFLWREAGGRKFFVLSARPPALDHPAFEVETRPFDPSLMPGDRLAFSLRVNATKAAPPSPDKNGPRSARYDVAMRALHAVPPGGRAEKRQMLAEQAALDWLAARSAAAGFRLIEHAGPEGERRVSACLEDYRVMRLPRRRRERPATFGVFDLEGVLEVTEPAAFLDRLHKGFGRAKAFGCGLMLVRRAP